MKMSRLSIEAPLFIGSDKESELQGFVIFTGSIGHMELRLTKEDIADIEALLRGKTKKLAQEA